MFPDQLTDIVHILFYFFIIWFFVVSFAYITNIFFVFSAPSKYPTFTEVIALGTDSIRLTWQVGISREFILKVLPSSLLSLSTMH